MMAREASIYTGVTVAEYFRDMGHDAVVIADSTSRWAEALREFASRAGALPAEEGYPASLPSALAAFYERAGRVTTLGGESSSVTVIGAVSPPGGDTTEPVTAHTQRFVRAVWGLDRELAYARHYPAVAWASSFSRDAEQLGRWYAQHGDPEWGRRRARVTGLLAEADRLGDLAALVGAGSLPGHERVVLLAGRLLREGVLQQNALSPNDAHCSAEKTAALVDAVLAVVDEAEAAVGRGVLASEVEELDFSPLLRAAAECPADDTDAGRRASGAGAGAGQGAAMSRSPAPEGRAPALTVAYSDIEEIHGPLMLVRRGVRGRVGRVRGHPDRRGRAGGRAPLGGAPWHRPRGRPRPGRRAGASRAPTASSRGHDRRLLRSARRDPGRGAAGWGASATDGGNRSTADRRSPGRSSAPWRGHPLNPTRRDRPSDPVLTGISADRRPHDPRSWPEAADLLGRRPATPRAGRADRRTVDRGRTSRSASSSRRWA